jgi:hypothetical protein
MTIFLLTFVGFAFGIAGFFLLLMADGRRLRERMRERRPRFVADEAETETPLVTPDYSLWMAPPFPGPETPRSGGHRSLYSTTPESPGLG